LRYININGYIDEYEWWGDEITPDMLHESLYGEGDTLTDDVHIRLCSYGGSSNAAVRMYDDIRAYPGSVTITVSGTAASAATVLAMAADKLEMSPGSLWMIHDPSIFAWGNEHDLNEAVSLLKACKESIINVYSKRCKKTRDEISGMMTAATWMDAKQALADGFIDSILDDTSSVDPINAAGPRVMNRKDAEAKVQAWLDRHNPIKLFGRIEAGKAKASRVCSEQKQQDDMTSTSEPAATEKRLNATAAVKPADEPPLNPAKAGTPVARLEHRLGLITPAERKKGGIHHEQSS
jgi:ATP-dependent Clp protease protease subunit